MLDQVTIHQLDLFLVAAKLKNFSRAADQMAISQPAFSAQIIKLEGILGITPVRADRQRRVELTETGAVFEDLRTPEHSFDIKRGQASPIDDMTSKVIGTLRKSARRLPSPTISCQVNSGEL